jgi:hypothetical protein
VGSGGDLLQQALGQGQVEHGGFVDDEEVGVQGVAVEQALPRGAVGAQQPVHGGGRVAGQVGEAFGGAAGRRGQADVRAGFFGEVDQGADGEALSAAGAAGHHGDRLGQRHAHGPRLGLVQGGGAGREGQGAGGPVAAAGERARSCLVEAGQVAGEAGFGGVQAAGEHRRGLPPQMREEFHGDVPGTAQGVEFAGEPLLVLAGQGGGGAQQGLFGQIAVALDGALVQGVQEGGAQPLGALQRGAEPQGDGVGEVEADTADLGEPVGVVADEGVDIRRLGGEVVADAGGVAGRDAGGVQEQHHLADVLVELPRLDDGGVAAGSDQVDLEEPVRVLLEDPQGVGAELSDDRVGESQADAFDQAGREVAAHRVHGRGQRVDAVGGGELASASGVLGPGTGQAQGLPRLGAGEDRARGPDRIQVAGVQQEHGVAVPVDEHDPLDHTVDVLRRFGRGHAGVSWLVRRLRKDQRGADGLR